MIEPVYHNNLFMGCCSRAKSLKEEDACTSTIFYGDLTSSSRLREERLSRRPVFQYDCTVSHKYKFIFPHIYKSGGSNLKNWFISVLCDGKRLMTADGRHPTADKACASSLLEHTSCSALQRHPDYFSFAFVRHPLNRTISQVRCNQILIFTAL